jgi:hypothetical protein
MQRVREEEIASEVFDDDESSATGGCELEDDEPSRSLFIELDV